MQKHRFEETVSVSDAHLHVVVEVGEVAIRSHENPTIAIDAKTQHMEILVYREQDTVYVRVEREEAWQELAKNLNRLTENDVPRSIVNIRVPLDCEVRAKTISGKLSVSGIKAPINTHVITGNTRLDDLGGPISAKTMTGSLHYHGPLTNERHRFKATTGEVYLNLTETPNARLDAQTTTGGIRCNLPMKEKIERWHVTGASLQAVLGSGKGDIRARVITGSVTLSRSNRAIAAY